MNDAVNEVEPSAEQAAQAWIEEHEAKCFITPVVIDGGRVVVETDEFHYSGKLTIPDTAKRKPTTGHVVRVSDIEKFGDLLGKRILYGVYAGTQTKFRNADWYRIMDTREILGIVEREDVKLEDIE